MRLVIDPQTYSVLPWSPPELRRARVFCDIYQPDGEPFSSQDTDIFSQQVVDIQRGVEVIEFARLTLNSEYHVRFIEFMPSGNNDYWSSDKYIATDELKKTIETISPLTPVRMRKDGPSRYFRLKGAKGVIGFISARKARSSSRSRW